MGAGPPAPGTGTGSWLGDSSGSAGEGAGAGHREHHMDTWIRAGGREAIKYSRRLDSQESAPAFD